MSLVFETIEDILGIGVIKPDEVSSDSTDQGQNPSLNRLIKDRDNVKTHIVTIERLKHDFTYINDLITGVGLKGAVNKSLVVSINETFPELLATVVNINDFTDIPTRTNINVITNFLEGKANLLKDELIVAYNELIKSLEDIENVTKANASKDLYGQLADAKDCIIYDSETISNNKSLQVFKDGELFKLYNNALNNNVLATLKLVPIDKLDLNTLIIRRNSVVNTLELLESIDNSTGLTKDSSYDVVLSYLAQLDIDAIINQYNTDRDIVTNILNERRLLVDVKTYRKDVVNKISETSDIFRLDVIANSIAKVLCLHTLYANVTKLNTVLLEAN